MRTACSATSTTISEDRESDRVADDMCRNVNERAKTLLYAPSVMLHPVNVVSTATRFVGCIVSTRVAGLLHRFELVKVTAAAHCAPMLMFT
jgi:hypothetical protein